MPRPVPKRDYASAPTLDHSNLAGITTWSGNAKIQTARGSGNDRELYIIFRNPPVEGWVRFTALPPGYRRCAAASAGRQDRVRRREQGLPSPEPGPRSKRRRDERRDSGAAVDIMPQQQEVKAEDVLVEEVAVGAADGMCETCRHEMPVATEAEESLLQAARERGVSVAAMEICRVCALAAERKKNVRLFGGYRDCTCHAPTGCSGCFVKRTRKGMEWLCFKLEMAKWNALDGEGRCECSRPLDNSGVWSCEACGGIGVLPGTGIFAEQ